MGVTWSLPKSATNAVAPFAGPAAAPATATATGPTADGNGLARPPGPEVDRSDVVRIQVHHRRDAVVAGPAGSDRHRVGFQADMAECRRMGGRVDLRQGVVALGDDQGPRSPAV